VAARLRPPRPRGRRDLGLGAAWGLGRLVERQLFGLGPVDLPVVASATVTVAAVALLASAWPARRAASISTALALRAE
jgi:hypothetical protein